MARWRFGPASRSARLSQPVAPRRRHSCLKLTKPYWNARRTLLTNVWPGWNGMRSSTRIELHALVPIAQVLSDQVRHLGGDADPTAERRLRAISDAYQNQQGRTPLARLVPMPNYPLGRLRAPCWRGNEL